MSGSIVGLDIGTSFVRVVIGEINEDGELQISGVGAAPSSGLKHGLVVNIEATVAAVQQAIEAAEMMSGIEVERVIACIGGEQIESMSSNGVVAVADKNTREITQEDVNRAIELATAVPISPARQLLHTVPQGFSVDGTGGIATPIDMIGVRLGVDVLIVTAAITSLKNVIRVIKRSGIEVDSIMLKTLASVQAVTTEEERQLGSIIIDLGGGSTDAMVLIDGAPLCTATVPAGGINVTQDISYICGISFDVAERIKKSSGCCWEPLLDAYEAVLIPGVGGRPPEEISRNDICRIMQPRMEEILCMIRDKIAALISRRQLMGNIILIGGGAQMPGIVDLVSNIFETRSVRIGSAGNFGGLHDEYHGPEFASAVGLVVSNLDKSHETGLRGADAAPEKKGKFFSQISDFFKEFF